MKGQKVENKIDEWLNVYKTLQGKKISTFNQKRFLREAKTLIQSLRKENKDARALINGTQTIWLVYGIDSNTNDEVLVGAFKCYYEAQKFAEVYSTFGNGLGYKIKGIEVK